VIDLAGELRNNEPVIPKEAPVVQKINIRPIRPSLVVGLIVTSAFLIFGIVFMVVLIKERSWPGVAFLAFWILIILVMIGYLAYMLATRRTVVDIETEIAPPAGEAGPDFDDKLRKLEALKKDGLVTDEEYRAKRAEIMKKSW
jgi:hypothetical protein